jgi:hypothetical protein
MKFHSDLFGWEYVWRNFADEKGGRVVTDSGEDEGKLISLTIPVEGSGVRVIFAPESRHGKKASSNSVMVCYPPAGDFAFSIFQEKMHHQLGKAVGLQDLKVQDDLFDSKFMIQGNNAVKVQELFLEGQLRELILLQPPSLLHIDTSASKTYPKFGIPHDVHALVYHYDGVMDKLHHLETAYDIVIKVLQQLGSIGAISGIAADIREEDDRESEQVTTQSKRLRSPLLDR